MFAKSQILKIFSEIKNENNLVKYVCGNIQNNIIKSLKGHE